MGVKRRVLITGAAGFLGSHAVEHFLENTDWDVVGMISLRHKGEAARLVHLIDNPRFQVVYHDLRAPISSRTVLEMGEITDIVNYASESHVDRSIAYPASFITNNVEVMVNILEYARRWRQGLKTFVQISTDEVYGPAPAGHDHAEWEPHYPSNPYSASKSAQEAIAFSYWRTYGIPLIITNCMNLIGERQDREKYLPMLISKISRGETVNIHGQRVSAFQNLWHPGSRFYLHARNLADAVMTLINSAVAQKYHPDGIVARPEKYHIVGEREVDNFELAQLVAEELGKELKFEWMDFHSSRPGHDLRYALDGRKIAYLGWRAPISFQESLRRTIQWTIKNPDWR